MKIFIWGNMTVEVELMLQLILLLYLDEHPHIDFQQDIARPHIARRSINFFSEAWLNVLANSLQIFRGYNEEMVIQFASSFAVSGVVDSERPNGL